MNIIAFVNQKGGVGKTSLSVNLGALLADAGKKTIILDNDSQANATNTLLNIKPDKTLYDVIINNVNLHDVIYKTDINNLDIIPNCLKSIDINILISTKLSRELLLKNAIDKAALNYDYMLIDCNPSLDLNMINALATADNVIIPIDSSSYSITGLSNLINFINDIKAINHSLKIQGFVLNRIDRRSNLTDTIREAIDKAYPGLLLKQDISLANLFTKMTYDKETIIAHKKTKTYKELNNLLQEVIK